MTLLFWGTGELTDGLPGKIEEFVNWKFGSGVNVLKP